MLPSRFSSAVTVAFAGRVQLPGWCPQTQLYLDSPGVQELCPLSPSFPPLGGSICLTEASASAYQSLSSSHRLCWSVTVTKLPLTFMLRTSPYSLTAITLRTSSSHPATTRLFTESMCFSAACTARSSAMTKRSTRRMLHVVSLISPLSLYADYTTDTHLCQQQFHASSQFPVQLKEE